MANTILLKSRQTDATGPGATALKVGELAVNTNDGRVYLGTDMGGTAGTAAGGTASASTNIGAPILNDNNFTANSQTSLATQASIKSYVDSNAGTGDIQGVTAGDGLSGGGSTGTVSLALDLNELTAATVAVGSDSIPIIDASDNSSKKESIADLVSGMAGSGLSASSGQLSLTSNSTTIAADSGTAHAIELSETLTVSGTANEIETSISDNTLTIGIPTNPTFGNTTVSGLVATGNITADIEGDLTLDINGGDLYIDDDGEDIFRIRNNGGDSVSLRSDKAGSDMKFMVKASGGATKTPFTLLDSGVIAQLGSGSDADYEVRIISDGGKVTYGYDQDVESVSYTHLTLPTLYSV